MVKRKTKQKENTYRRYPKENEKRTKAYYYKKSNTTQRKIAR